MNKTSDEVAGEMISDDKTGPYKMLIYIIMGQMAICRT